MCPTKSIHTSRRLWELAEWRVSRSTYEEAEHRPRNKNMGSDSNQVPHWGFLHPWWQPTLTNSSHWCRHGSLWPVVRRAQNPLTIQWFLPCVSLNSVLSPWFWGCFPRHSSSFYPASLLSYQGTLRHYWSSIKSGSWRMEEGWTF